MLFRSLWVRREGCWDAAERGEKGRSGGAALPFSVLLGDMTRDGDLGDSNCGVSAMCQLTIRASFIPLLTPFDMTSSPVLRLGPDVTDIGRGTEVGSNGAIPNS